MQTGHDRTDPTNSSPRRSLLSATALATLLAAAVLLPLLGHRPLTDWDEGIYAEIAREMLAAHTLHAWLIPHWNGHLWFEKPPLQMWLTAALLRLFGLNAFAARLPSALAGVSTVAVLHTWLQHRLNTLTAWLGTLILLSAFGFQHIARVGETDTLLTLFCLLATLGLAELLQNNAGGWLLFFTGFGLALMTKGAASITLPLTALALAAIHPRHLLRHARAFTLGLLLFLAITVPWHAYVYLHFGHAFLHDYLGFHTLTRATSAIEGHRTHPWFYLWVLLISAPLASLLYPWAIAAPFRPPARKPRRNLKSQNLNAQTSTSPSPGQTSLAQRSNPNETPAFPNLQPNKPPHSNPLQALAAFALTTLVVFSAAGTRLPHYIAPAYPPLSALTAALVAQWLQAHPPRTRQIALGLGSAALILYAAAALLTGKPRKALHNAQLIDGFATPDNREAVGLLQRLQRLPPASLPGDPLLLWRTSPVAPVTTAAFYAHRLVQQVALAPSPPNLPADPYFNNPKPLTDAVPSARLILLDTSLASHLPPTLHLQPLASTSSQTLAIITPLPATKQ